MPSGARQRFGTACSKKQSRYTFWGAVSKSMTILAAAQGLTERNPASHAIWVVATITLAALAVMVGIEVFDWVRERIKNRRAGLSAPEEQPEGFHLHEPDTELHHRYEQRLPKVASREQRANEPLDRLR